jgi:hypothetical protein
VHADVHMPRGKPCVSPYVASTHVVAVPVAQSASLVHAPNKPPSHVPAVQVPPVLHAMVHAPQCMSFDITSMHAPPHAS